MGFAKHHPHCYVNLQVTEPVIHTNVDPSLAVIELPSSVDPSSKLGRALAELQALAEYDGRYSPPTVGADICHYLRDLISEIYPLLISVLGPESSAQHSTHPLTLINRRLAPYYDWTTTPATRVDDIPPLSPSEALYLLDVVRSVNTLSREFRRLNVPYGPEQKLEQMNIR